MSKKTLSINFVGDHEIELVIPDDLYLTLEKNAKLKGVSVQILLSSELLRVHSTDK
jgi:hypothetical protein